MSDREDLEAKVSELQAAVDGLTEELVETKERLRELEEARAAADDPEDDPDPTAAPGDTGSEIVASAREGADEGGDADAINTEDGDSGDNEGTEDSDIIVA